MNYISNHIPFFIILGILIISIALLFLSSFFKPRYFEFIRDNFLFCITLCAFTIVADFAFTKFLENIDPEFFALRSNDWRNSFLVMFSFSGLLLSLRVIPFVGKFLQWGAWIILTIPLRIYFLLMARMPAFHDIVNLITVKLETSFETISTFLTYSAVLSASIPSAMVVIVMYSIKFKHNKCDKNFQRISAFILGILFFAAYFVNPEGILKLNDSMGGSINAVWETAKALKYSNIKREKFSQTSTDVKRNNIVFILDESIRGDYLSVNNLGINTTPKLEKYLNDYPKNIFNYGLMLSVATYSYPSRASLLMGLDRVNDDNLATFKNPTLFDIAKANNYKTILINVQGDLPDFAFTSEDMKNADEIYLKFGSKKFFLNRKDDDFEAAEFVNKRLVNEEGLFIFLEKFGAHVPYFMRYPVNEPEFNVFTPYLKPSEKYSVENRRKIINSYKNAIRYNIDGFFERLFGENPKNLKDCTIIYTSDHGQSLIEYGKMIAHGNEYLEQAIVPFLIFSTDSWVLEHLKRPDEIPFTLHHLNIPATLRAMLCRDLNFSAGDYNSLVTTKDFKKPPLIYLTKGHPYSGEFSEPVSTDIDGKMILPTNKYIY